MNWQCLFGHDWVYDDWVRVCLRCERLEHEVSVGGSWGGWVSVDDYRERLHKHAIRYEKMKYILGRKADQPSAVTPDLRKDLAEAEALLEYALQHVSDADDIYAWLEKRK